jgi:hypothetical protein
MEPTGAMFHQARRSSGTTRENYRKKLVSLNNSIA